MISLQTTRCPRRWVESSVLRHPEVHSGSGFAASPVADLGFEPTLGATSSDAKPRRVRKKTIEVGEGLSSAGVSAAGVSTGGVRLVEFRLGPRSARDARGEKGCLVALAKSQGLRQNARTTRTRPTGKHNGQGTR